MECFSIPEGLDLIKTKKQMNRVRSEAESRAKPSRCILCGSTQSSFCNSHSVPQFTLKAIARNGIVLHASAAMGLDEEIVDNENGIKKSGVFKYICRNCDNTFFRDYETESLLINKPTDKMLAEIAVKDMLMLMSRRTIDKELDIIEQKRCSRFNDFDDLLRVKEQDIREFEEEIYFHKGIADRDETGGYQILFWKVLPYVIPVAAQSAMALKLDMDGKIINDVYDKDPNIRMQYIHLCFFPLKCQSVILFFYHKRDKLYRSLRHQINSSSEEKICRYLNYLMFEYTENYYIAKSIEHEIKNNLSLHKLSQEYNGFTNFGYLNASNHFGIGYTPVSMDEIPNFLDEKWAVVRWKEVSRVVD